MPNHVATKVTIIGSDENLKTIEKFVASEQQLFDFNKIVPIPETYVKYDTTNHPDAKGLVVGERLNWEKDSPIVTEELISEYKKATREQFEKYGVVGWYDWKVMNWGTKWNCYDISKTEVRDGFLEYTFNTAWDFAKRVIVALSEFFPEVEIQFVYADEDVSYNTGRGSVQNGKLDIYCPNGGSDDAYELYFETHPGSSEEMHKDENGKWVWNE